MEKKRGQTRREVLKGAGVLAAGAAAGVLLGSGSSNAASSKVPRWSMVIDTRRCLGCRACTVACKAEFNVPLGRWNAVVKQLETGTFPKPETHLIPRLCNHCSGGEGKRAVPPCVDKCPEAKSGERARLGGERYRRGATYKRPDGMILLEMEHCIGCGKCIKACPYGARYFDPSVKLTRSDREKDIGVGKCTFCAHRVDRGVAPSCVNTCPGNARIFGDINDSDSEISRLIKEFKLEDNRGETTILPHEATFPYVFYIDPKGSLKIYSFDKDKKEAEFRDQLS